MWTIILCIIFSHLIGLAIVAGVFIRIARHDRRREITGLVEDTRAERRREKEGRRGAQETEQEDKEGL